jgi:hypothetical protein
LDGDQPVARPLPTYRTIKTQNKRTQTSMPGVGFEPTIPVSERPKMVHALDRGATVVGNIYFSVTTLYEEKYVPVGLSVWQSFSVLAAVFPPLITSFNSCNSVEQYT